MTNYDCFFLTWILCFFFANLTVFNLKPEKYATSNTSLENVEAQIKLLFKGYKSKHNI